MILTNPGRLEALRIALAYLQELLHPAVKSVSGRPRHGVYECIRLPLVTDEQGRSQKFILGGYNFFTARYYSRIY